LHLERFPIRVQQPHANNTIGFIRHRTLTYEHILAPAPNSLSDPLPAFIPPAVDGAPQFLAVEIAYWQHGDNEEQRGQLADASLSLALVSMPALSQTADWPGDINTTTPVTRQGQESLGRIIAWKLPWSAATAALSPAIEGVTGVSEADG